MYANMGSIGMYKHLLNYKFFTQYFFCYCFPYGQYSEDLNSWFQHKNRIWSLESLQCCMAVFSRNCLRMMLSFNFRFVSYDWKQSSREKNECHFAWIWNIQVTWWENYMHVHLSVLWILVRKCLSSYFLMKL
jgi:hypothetical protein